MLTARGPPLAIDTANLEIVLFLLASCGAQFVIFFLKCNAAIRNQQDNVFFLKLFFIFITNFLDLPTFLKLTCGAVCDLIAYKGRYPRIKNNLYGTRDQSVIFL
jgi:hypothetical protein